MGAYEAGVQRGLQDQGVRQDAAPKMVVPRMPSNVNRGDLMEINGSWEPVQELGLVDTKWCRVKVLDHWFALDVTLSVRIKTHGITDAEMKTLVSKRRAPIGDMRP